MPKVIATTSKLMPDSEDVMGWDVKNNGLHVIFSKSIPSIITKWLGPFVHEFLAIEELTKDDITHFVAHPGGKKVLEAYEAALGFDSTKTDISRDILRENGNMSSPTVLYVLERFMENEPVVGDYGLMAALGPGFCGELLITEMGVRWILCFLQSSLRLSSFNDSLNCSLRIEMKNGCGVEVLLKRVRNTIHLWSRCISHFSFPYL